MPVEYRRLSAALGPSARGLSAQHRWPSKVVRLFNVGLCQILQKPTLSNCVRFYRRMSRQRY